MTRAAAALGTAFVGESKRGTKVAVTTEVADHTTVIGTVVPHIAPRCSIAALGVEPSGLIQKHSCSEKPSLLFNKYL